jgi:hypothetical protein
MRTIVIGLGTGRCGTQSLATFLGQQPYAGVTHESLRLPWIADAKRFDSAFRLLLARPGKVIGDVASYWLPYAPMLAGAVSARGGLQLRFVYLHRDTDEVVRSFMHRTAGKDHWCEGLQTGDPYDECFPHYPLSDKALAIRRYCDDYAARYETYRAASPDIFHPMPMRALSSPDALAVLLGWLDLPIIEIHPVHCNRGHNEPRPLVDHHVLVRTKSRFGARARFVKPPRSTR